MRPGGSPSGRKKNRGTLIHDIRLAVRGGSFLLSSGRKLGAIGSKLEMRA
jgi:hypothetical protein